MMMNQYIQYITLALLISASNSALSFECHPQIDSKRSQYIIGYGSLIDEQSKRKTDKTAQENRPITLKGYQRSWSIHGTHSTFLSVTEKAKASFNGVIYKLKHPHHIRKYDQREKGYCRKEIFLHQINTFGINLPQKIQCWIYISNHAKNESPSATFPIMQSYVDTFLRGCIQIEEKYQIKDFAKRCILTTTQWSNAWINDRTLTPKTTSESSKIDALLKKNNL